MKLKDMEIGIQYVVTKGGSTLHVGDSVRIDYVNRLMCPRIGEWLDRRYWVRLRNEVEIDFTFYKDEKVSLENQIKEINAILSRKNVKAFGNGK